MAEAVTFALNSPEPDPAHVLDVCSTENRRCNIMGKLSYTGDPPDDH